MSTIYQPGQVPDDPKELVLFLRRELAAIKQGLEQAKPLDELSYLHAQPARLRKGMLVLADGSDWNPGYGAGMYRRNEANDAWIFCAASPMEAVIAPTLLNSWVNYNAALDQAAGYWKDSFGLVHLRGLIKNGVVGSAAFTLPAGYRPSLIEHFAVDATGAFGGVYIDASGNVTPYVGATTYFSLAGITFRAA